MQIPFMKLSGAGNDFVIIDNRQDLLPLPPVKLAEKVCRRRLSIGADGLLLVELSAKADFKMRYFNADGSEAETCGNGARCIAQFAYLNGIVPADMHFETQAGLYSAEITGDQVKVRLSDPTRGRLSFPLQLTAEVCEVSFVNTGVPHIISLVSNLETVNLVGLGREIRNHDNFAPAGTNVNFIQIKGDRKIEIRTYERGVEDETLACGTGSVAAAIIAALLGEVTPPVAVTTAGGTVLTVYFDFFNSCLSDEMGREIQVTNVHLEGDARLVCQGQLTSSAWNY